MGEGEGKGARGVARHGPTPLRLQPNGDLSVPNPMYGHPMGRDFGGKGRAVATHPRGPLPASEKCPKSEARADQAIGAARPHYRVRYEFLRDRERALYALLALGVLLFLIQLSTSSSDALWALLSAIIFAVAALISVLLLANNLRWANAKHAVLSFPFVTSVGASAVNIIADWVTGRGVGAAAVLLLSISVPMVHLCCVVVYRRLVLGILLLGLSSSTALVVTASLFAEDEDLFSVGEVTYTYFSVRRSCIATLWTTTIVLLMSSVQKRNGPHAHLLVPVSALQHEPWLEDAVGLPAWALTRARAAVMVNHGPTTPVAAAVAVGGARSPPQGRAAARVRALVAVKPAVAGGGHPLEAPDRVEASWRVVHALHRFARARGGATSASAALILERERLPRWVKSVVATATVTGVGLYFAIQVLPACARAVLAPIVPVCVISSTLVLFHGRSSPTQLRRAAQQPNSWIVWAWLALLTANNTHRLMLWARRGEPCNVVRLASNVLSLDSVITAFLLIPAMRVRAHLLESSLAFVCLTTQVFLAARWSLFPSESFYRISLPGGSHLDEQDVLRNCYFQLALSLFRIIVAGLLSDKQLRSPFRKRATHRAGQRPALRNRGLQVLAPRRNQVDAYVVDLVGEILAHGVSRSLREATSPEAWAAAEQAVPPATAE